MTYSRKQFLKMMGIGAASAALPGGRLWASAPPQAEIVRAGTPRLKIRDVEIYPFDIKLAKPFTVSLGTITSSNSVLIRVLTDSGIVGIGESSPIQPITGETQRTNIEVALQIREMLKGKDPLAIESEGHRIGDFMHSNPSIVAAFDMAFHDIMGKVAGLPVFRLLGGDKKEFETDVTLGIDAPAAMAAAAKAQVAAGFRTLKVKIGLDPEADIVRVRAIREAVGDDLPIRLDANQGYTVPQAVYALRHMEKYKIQLCEQPGKASDFAGMRQVRQESPIPVMADESLFLPSDAVKLIREEACDYFNIKLMKAGGMSNALAIATIAEAANIRCMLGCMMESRIGLTAAAHVSGARGNIIYADLDSYLTHAADPVVDGIIIRNGTVTIPEKPGLGVDIDPAFLKTLKKL